MFLQYDRSSWKNNGPLSGKSPGNPWALAYMQWYFFIFACSIKADWNSTAKHIKLGFRADIKIPVNGDIYRDGIRAPNSELFLFGVLEYDFQQQIVSGKLGMRGIWRKAFFIPFLGIGNIFLG